MHTHTQNVNLLINDGEKIFNNKYTYGDPCHEFQINKD